MNLPNIVSLIRLVILPFMLYFMYRKTPFSLCLAFILFIIGSASDTLDGYLARFLKKETRFGAALDQICDKVFTTSIFLMMTILQWIKGIDIIPIFVILFRDFAISGLRQFYVIKSDPIGKFKMVAQLVTIFSIFVSILIGPIFELERIFLWISCVLTIVSFINYLRYV